MGLKQSIFIKLYDNQRLIRHLLQFESLISSQVYNIISKYNIY